MGWLHDHDLRHEGYLVALAERETGSGMWRERRYPVDNQTRPVARFAVACTCGWRSPRFHAAPGVMWQPFTVEAPDAIEAEARALWESHVLGEAPRMGPTLLAFREVQ